MNEGMAIAAAFTAAESIRTLNHATRGRAGYEWPSDVSTVLGELLAMSQRLSQALGQAARWLDAAETAGRVGHDRGADVRTAVEDVLADLDRARREAGSLALALESAHCGAGHLTGLLGVDD